MVKSIRFITILSIIIQFVSCGNGNEEVSPFETEQSVNSTVMGFITNRNGQTLSGVTVEFDKQTVISTEKGTFTFGKRRLSSDKGGTLKCSKAGYYTCFKKFSDFNGVSHVVVVLSPLIETDDITSSEADTVFKSRCGLYFGANSLVKTNGEKFVGIAKCYFDILDGLDAGFQYSANGNGFVDDVEEAGYGKKIFSAIGHFRVKITDENNNELNVVKATPIQLHAPVPANMMPNVPATCPLWLYDEINMKWVRKGNAFYDETSMTYKALLDMAGTWMIAFDDETGYVAGKVSCGSKPCPNILVNVGQFAGMTDSDGLYRIKAPISRQIIAVVERALNGGLTAPARSVKLETKDEIREMNMELQLCGATLVGKVVGCTDSPLTAIVIIKSSNGFMTTRPVTDKGEFKVTVPPSVLMSVGAFGGNSNYAIEQNVQPLTSGEQKDVGTLKVCLQ